MSEGSKHFSGKKKKNHWKKTQEKVEFEDLPVGIQ